MLDFTGIAIDSMDNWLGGIVTLVGGVIQAQFSPFAPIGLQAGGAPLRAGDCSGDPVSGYSRKPGTVRRYGRKE